MSIKTAIIRRLRLSALNASRSAVATGLILATNQPPWGLLDGADSAGLAAAALLRAS